MSLANFSAMYFVVGLVFFLFTVGITESFVEGVAAAVLWPLFLLVIVYEGAFRLYERITQ
jgi:hypothetical protein